MVLEGGTTRLIQLGCGITGLVCAEHLAENKKVDEIVLADSRIEPARSMLSRVKNEKMSILRTDGTDAGELRKLMKDCDLIISSLPWEMNRKVLDVAASTGTDYVDFCLTAESEDELKAAIAKCRKAGIRALTATGEDPGISDVMAVQGARQLDVALEAHVRDGDSGIAEGVDFFSLWSPIDLLEETTVPAAVFRDGRMTFVPPLDKREIYEFPPPVGPLPVYYTNHEETYLMPRFIKGLRNADFQIAIDDGFASAAKMLRKLGLHSLKPVDVKGVKVRPLDVVVSLMPRPVDLVGKVKGHAVIVVDVIGEKDGEKKQVKMWTMMSHEKAYELCRSNATGYLVGSGGAVAAEMLIEGEVKEHGLIAPEQLPSEKFLARLPSKGLTVEQRITPL